MWSAEDSGECRDSSDLEISKQIHMSGLRSTTVPHTWCQWGWVLARRWRSDSGWASAPSSKKHHPVQHTHTSTVEWNIFSLLFFLCLSGNDHLIIPPWFCSSPHRKNPQFHFVGFCLSCGWTRPRCSVLFHLCPRLLLFDRLNCRHPTKILRNTAMATTVQFWPAPIVVIIKICCIYPTSRTSQDKLWVPAGKVP